MKLAASNIAWTYSDRLEAYAVLRDHGFSGLEIAPGLFFAEEPDPFDPSEQSVAARLLEIETFGLELVSMQSILFGVQGAVLFGAPQEVEQLATGMKKAIALAGRLGIKNLVFGSPKQRVVPIDMTFQRAIARAREVFTPLGDYAASCGTSIALEPNAAAYGTNFMTTLEETLDVVEAIDHPAITLNFDTGALHMTDSFDAVDRYMEMAIGRISHIHLSCAYLTPAPASQQEALSVLNAAKTLGYDKAVSIEMKAVADDGLAILANSVGKLQAASLASGFGRQNFLS